MHLLKKILILYLCIICSVAFAADATPIRYVALGDSYTIGIGAQMNESWPAVLTNRLQKKGFQVELVSNLGHDGWTSQNLIDGELPQLQQLKPDFVTLLIGVNDWVQGVDVSTFKNHLEYILDELLKAFHNSKRILIVTIPDFSVTPTGKLFAHGRDITLGIKGFNQIIFKEAQSRGLKVVDVFSLSQTMGQDYSLVAQDGLHPSAKEYAQWADLIEPAWESLGLEDIGRLIKR